MQTQGQSPYPRGGGQFQGAGRREIDFDVIGEAFRLLFANIGPFLIGGLVILLVMGFAVGLPYMMMFGGMMAAGNNDGAALGAMLGGMVFLMIGAIAGGAVAAVVGGGMCHVTLKICRGESVEIGDVFAGFRGSAIPLAVSGLLIGLGVGIGSNLCYIPGLILGGLWMLTYPMIMERRLGAIDAMRESWMMLKDQWIMAGVIYLVAALIASLGALVCGIGMLVTWPLFYIIPALIYRDFTAYQQNAAYQSATAPVAPMNPYSYSPPAEAPAPQNPYGSSAPNEEPAGDAPVPPASDSPAEIPPAGDEPPKQA